MFVPGKGDQIESVVGIEIVERELHSLFSFLNWKAGHRSRSVEHENQLLRRYVFDRNSLGRLQDQGKEAAIGR